MPAPGPNSAATVHRYRPVSRPGSQASLHFPPLAVFLQHFIPRAARPENGADLETVFLHHLRLGHDELEIPRRVRRPERRVPAAAAGRMREPDAFLGLLGLGLSMGQWLSIPMILFGIYLLKRKSVDNFH